MSESENECFPGNVQADETEQLVARRITEADLFPAERGESALLAAECEEFIPEDRRLNPNDFERSSPESGERVLEEGEVTPSPSYAQEWIPRSGEAGQPFRENLPECFFHDDPTLWLYRDRTVAMLRRYFRFSIEVGRLPSLLGREFFRTRVTVYRVGTFEDAVIFVRDVERCLEELDEEECGLVGQVVFQNFTHNQAARLLRSHRRTVGRRLPDVLDHLSEIFLKYGILERLPGKFPNRENACQESKMDEFPLSACEQGKNNFSISVHSPQ
jgi:hypothetical protein